MSRKKIAEESYQVPIWVITFSDMTTNLLTFFVLLLSMGHIRDETLFDQGQASIYLESVKRGFGIKETSDFENIKIKYFITGPGDLFEGRTIDAKEEELRRTFTKVDRSMTTMPSQIVAKKTSFSVTDIRFSPGQVTLNESAKKYLAEFCLALQNSPRVFSSKTKGGISQQNPDSKAGIIYVLGLADEPDVVGSDPVQGATLIDPAEKLQQDSRGAGAQWLLSARRAQAVADFLQSALGGRSEPPEGQPSGPAWHIYWWGAGPGGDWVAQDSPISRLTQILIAVLWAND